jgi:hypothetical protein
MNEPTARTVKIDLAFLGFERAKALIARDRLEEAGAIEVETRDVSRGQPLEIAMRPAGGFVIRLTR